eukprot:2554609-Rhodomonas_salina.2
MSGTDIGYHAGNLATDVEYCAGSERETYFYDRRRALGFDANLADEDTKGSDEEEEGSDEEDTTRKVPTGIYAPMAYLVCLCCSMLVWYAPTAYSGMLIPYAAMEIALASMTT